MDLQLRVLSFSAAPVNPNYDYEDGTNSTFSNISSSGGGKGGTIGQVSAAPGGSGGGGGSNYNSGGQSGASGNAGGYSPSEGNAGGTGDNTRRNDLGFGGGGGGGLTGWNKRRAGRDRRGWGCRNCIKYYRLICNVRWRWRWWNLQSWKSICTSWSWWSRRIWRGRSWGSNSSSLSLS